MKNTPARNAGIASALLALVVIVLIYTLVCTVDIVFKDGEREVYRIEDATVLSDLAVTEIDGSQFVYNNGSASVTFSDSFEFRFEIAKTVLLNLVSFDWQDMDYVMQVKK